MLNFYNLTNRFSDYWFIVFILADSAQLLIRSVNFDVKSLKNQIECHKEYCQVSNRIMCNNIW